ncbi:transposase [Nitrococcus mobilis]|nr:transposase [Nitrococcus mobilis]
MPRKPRFYLSDMPAHVMQRGHNRQPVFFDDQDYLEYLKILKRVSDACRCAIHAYVLMTNHIHLLLTPGTGGSVSRLFQECGRQYVGYINRTYRRRGTLWEGRHKGMIIESETYLLTCMRYIELNPVRAGMVARPRHYRWSSYAVNALGEENCIVSPREEYLRLGQTRLQRWEAYRALFDTELSVEELDRIRNCAQSGTPMGNNRFKEQIEKTLRKNVGWEKRGRPVKTSVVILPWGSKGG